MRLAVYFFVKAGRNTVNLLKFLLCIDSRFYVHVYLGRYTDISIKNDRKHNFGLYCDYQDQLVIKAQRL